MAEKGAIISGKVNNTKSDYFMVCQKKVSTLLK